MRILAADLAVGFAMAMVMVGPAFASVAAPAPIAGLGVGAAVLIGAGYRALRKRLDR